MMILVKIVSKIHSYWNNRLNNARLSVERMRVSGCSFLGGAPAQISIAVCECGVLLFDANK